MAFIGLSCTDSLLSSKKQTYTAEYTSFVKTVPKDTHLLAIAFGRTVSFDKLNLVVSYSKSLQLFCLVNHFISLGRSGAVELNNNKQKNKSFVFLANYLFFSRAWFCQECSSSRLCVILSVSV